MKEKDKQEDQKDAKKSPSCVVDALGKLLCDINDDGDDYRDASDMTESRSSSTDCVEY